MNNHPAPRLRHRPSTALLLATLLLLAAPAPVLAQTPVPIAVGNRVRVETADGDSYRGWVRALSADTIGIERRRGRPLMTLPTSDLRQLQVRVGTRADYGRAVRIAALVGATIGAIVFGMDDECSQYSCRRLVNAGLGAVAGGIMGAPVGLAFGGLIPAGIWEVGVVPSSTGPTGVLGIGVSAEVRRWR